MTHPDGGPWLGLVLDAERARAAAGFATSRSACRTTRPWRALAAHLTALGQPHAGVHFTTVGWILPKLHDPDGHEVRFYSMEAHTDLDPAARLIVDDAVSTARAKEQEWLARQASGAVADARG